MSLVVDNHLPADFLTAALRMDALRGLTASPKWLPPKWFYDERGSELFEQITRLPEYYPTRAERSILDARAGEIAAASRADTLVELGAGSAEKTRLLLDALRDATTLRRYVPVDVSESALRQAAVGILADYPGLAVHAVVADFEEHVDRLPGGDRRMVAFLGGTIGNLVPDERATFLRQVRAELRPGETLLLGTDLVKNPDVLVPAYDDAAGVTAEFNKNVLHVINRELKADFDPDAFAHVAYWDAAAEWIEMRLRSLTDQRVRVELLGLDVTFEAGEEMRTEVSAKFRREGVTAELAAAGFELTHWWTDQAGRFGLSLSTAR
jgi:L-histidine N-alpha-methyltransferase